MNADLENRFALVTGASRGIGRAVAQHLAGRGATVAVHYGSDAAAAADTVAAIERAGGRAFAVPADLAVPDAAERLWRAYDARAEGVDIVINNAGILGGRSPLSEVTPEAYDRVLAVNARAPFFVLQHAVDRLRDNGRVVNISTRFTHGARNPELIPYTMSKAAIDALTSTLARQLAPRGITVNAVGPGATATDMNAARLGTARGRAELAALSPFGRVGTPADVAGIVGLLVSADAGWLTGQWLDASGGSML